MLMLEEILSLPLEKKIGQLFFIGLKGSEIDAETRKLLEEISPGGVCLFARNIKTAGQTREFVNRIVEVLPVKPFLSIDQEGGSVDRLRRIVTPMPAAKSIVNSSDAEILARNTAEILSMLGLNMNFAPVVDVIDEDRAKANNGLFSRAFGNSKESAADLASVYLRNLQENGCLGCLKHFPGLGASCVDSHDSLPEVNLTLEELFSTDLFPYLKLFKSNRVLAVMVAHAAYPQIDLQETDRNGKLLPSSLSYNFVTELLRKKLKYENLIITDDLEMGAVLRNYSIGEACKMALLAGENMLSVCARPEAIREGFESVREACLSGEISENLINDSLEKIAFAKKSLHEPLELDLERLDALSLEIKELNERLNYKYGG